MLAETVVSSRVMDEGDEALDRVANALADRTRRRLLRLVRVGEHSAGDLASVFPGISRPAVSQHLRVLHDAGLVRVRADGPRRMYRVDAEGLAPITQFVDEMWISRLAELKRAAEHITSGRP